MSPAGKITKHIIKTEETPAFLFLGIVSTEPDYRLSVMLNRHLGIDLRKKPEEIAESSGDNTHSYSVFTTAPITFSLISNRSMGRTLLRKLKNIDFLLQIHGTPDRKQAEALAASLRAIPEVTAVFLFDSRDFGDKNIALLAL
jgi:hypothetical protein